VDVRRISPDDEVIFAQWYAIWHLTDQERWPDLPGWNAREIAAMARHGGAREHRLLAARDSAEGPVVGIGMMEVPHRDNLRSMGIDVRVHPEHRRRQVGTAVVDEAARRARAEGRTILHCLFEVPTEQLSTHPAPLFARAMGFGAVHLGNRRLLSLPMPEDRMALLKDVVATATQASDYRIVTFMAPWPEEFMDDQCEMARRMSTDQPSGDAYSEAEEWDAERVRESDALLAAEGLTKLTAVAQHIDTGRLVAFSEIVVSDARPAEAWQWSTLVLREHRGHRLGLAVKLANLEFLVNVRPTARRVDTGNAQDNAPMIAVNDMMGFEVVATGTFWQMTLEPIVPLSEQ
jgi:GNAT superfamily N-acetyltransferase